MQQIQRRNVVVGHSSDTLYRCVYVHARRCLSLIGPRLAVFRFLSAGHVEARQVVSRASSHRSRRMCRSLSP